MDELINKFVDKVTDLLTGPLLLVTVGFIVFFVIGGVLSQNFSFFRAKRKVKREDRMERVYAFLFKWGLIAAAFVGVVLLATGNIDVSD